jgi:hypothetical protein
LLAVSVIAKYVNLLAAMLKIVVGMRIQLVSNQEQLLVKM